VDPVAKAYIGTAYSHQPDLNFENEVVHAAVEKVCDFWFACVMACASTPSYLYEREGTNCETFPRRTPT
jgi:maltose alpha-D-glucosyltransferase/alpha-amylase